MHTDYHYSHSIIICGGMVLLAAICFGGVKVINQIEAGSRPADRDE